jgi:hypothetical protein
MRRFPALVGLCALLLGCASAARADAPPTPVPDVKADMSSMLFYLGTWNCYAKTCGSMRPDTTIFTLEKNGRWLHGHDVAPPFDRFRSRTVTSDICETYNRAKHQWIWISIDDFGTYGLTTSPG